MLTETINLHMQNIIFPQHSLCYPYLILTTIGWLSEQVFGDLFLNPFDHAYSFLE